MLPRIAIGLCAAVALGMGVGVAHAEYPERDITLIVPFAPGGGTDTTARMFVPYIERNLEGSNFVVVNRPGGAGEIGATEMALAEPDGYTIGFMNVPNTIANIYARDTRYNIESYDAIANLVFDPTIIAVRDDSPFETFEDLLEQASENPRTVTLGTPGVSSNNHIDLLLLEGATGVEFQPVHFADGAGNRTALLGGHIAGSVTALSDALRFAEDGLVRILNIWTEERSDIVPDIPTLAEQGYEIYSGSARGLVGPKGMPEEAITKLDNAVRLALEDPELQARAAEIGLPLLYMDSKSYGTYLRESGEALEALWEVAPWQ
jgi:tripartite-type tricarboxylate transporter receptor subunit TctC